jgi:hypothetical protein
VYYLDLVDITEKETLDIGAIIRGALLTRIKKGGAKGGPQVRELVNEGKEHENE